MTLKVIFNNDIAATFKYFYVVKVDELQKTDVYGCYAKKNNALLGIIKWLPQWRQYCFSANRDSVFSSSCHTNIASFLDGLNERHKSIKKG